MPTAADLMRRDVIALAPRDRVLEARETMRLGRLRQLPVVDGPWIVGEVSWRDVCLAYRAVLDEPRGAGARLRAAAVDALEVARVMQPTCDWVAPDELLAAVVARLARRGGGFVPVVEAEGGSRIELLGIVTANDLLRAALAAEGEHPAARSRRP